MRELNIPKEEIEKLTEEHKLIASHFAMPNGWNPMGNPEIFRNIQENIFNYFLDRIHTLDTVEIKLIKEMIKFREHNQQDGRVKT
jgi:hypothetical protein